MRAISSHTTEPVTANTLIAIQYTKQQHTHTHTLTISKYSSLCTCKRPIPWNIHTCTHTVSVCFDLKGLVSFFLASPSLQRLPDRLLNKQECCADDDHHKRQSEPDNDDNDDHCRDGFLSRSTRPNDRSPASGTDRQINTVYTSIFVWFYISGICRLKAIRESLH